MEKCISLKERIEVNFNKMEKNIEPSIPINMLLEVTNACNHNCIFCANSKSTRKLQFINSQFAERVIKEAYELGTREIGFYSTGEPLLNNNLEQYIKKAKEIGYDYTYITTNGALLNRERAESLVNSGIDSIKFSINSAKRENYKLIHGKDDYEKVYSNLKYLFEFREKNKLDFKIFISCILTRYTIEEKQLLREKFGQFSDEIIFLECKNQCGVMYEVNDRLTINRIEQKDICPLPFNKIHITCEGYLTACCADFQNYLAIENLNNTSLRKAWYSDNFKILRQKHLDKNLDGTLCYNCINNINKKIEPINLKISTPYKLKEFDKSEEIDNRIIEIQNVKI